MNIISLLNGFSVAVFGMILSASFCEITWNRKKLIAITASMAGLIGIQGIIIYFMETEMVRCLYPVVTHLPLMVVLMILTKRKLWSVVSVCTAYLCCQVRRWLALFITALLGGDIFLQNISELIITIPLLLFLLKYASPAIRSISYSNSWVMGQFFIIPGVYYVFDYVTQIYTDLLSAGTPVVAEFMSFICSVAYLVFVFRFSEEKWVRNQLEQAQDSLNLQVSQAVREIETMRQSQEITKQHRHDMRHHMQYLLSCMENGQVEHAKDYMQGICTEIEAAKITSFCENEAANLIFSSFVYRATEQGINLQIKAQISKKIHISESDLCVLLSNGLENALHACCSLKNKGKETFVEVLAFEKKHKLFLQIINSCDSDVSIVQGIPVTNRPGHGIGIRSICALVDRYDGIYTFEVIDRKFILRISL